MGRKGGRDSMSSVCCIFLPNGAFHVARPSTFGERRPSLDGRPREQLSNEPFWQN